MINLLKFFFYLSGFIIFWALIGYPFSLNILQIFFRNRTLQKSYNYQPTVTVMVVAHNEEKVIKEKLNNIISLSYPEDKIKYLIANDNSTDSTEAIINEFIANYPNFDIRVYNATERKGKTNAQNEAQKIVETEILVMTDANSILKEDAIKEIVSPFFQKNVSYVCGRLVYVNDENDTASLENTYWSSDLKMRKIESNIQTITAGNGALYACRNSEYFDFDPIRSHDANMPRYFALRGQKALFNEAAIAFEKAGENTEDEFKRKVRMNRGILKGILPSIKILNIFKYKWYTYFYLGHRTSRYLLWISHLIVFITSFILGYFNTIYLLAFIIQSIFYLLAFLNSKYLINNKITDLIYYYTMTIIAQWCGVINILTGKTKPFWEKAESTR